jgi:membrane protease YdiL (CAAX protease family)
VLLVTVPVCVVFYVINRLSSGYSSRFIALWLSGFYFAVLNLPFSTALLSGGGALTIFLLWSLRDRRREMRPARAGPMTEPAV